MINLKDPRYFQMITLSSLVAFQMFFGDFAPGWTVLAVVFLSVLMAQYMCSRVVKTRFDWRSPLITGLSISLLLKASALWLFPLAAVLAIVSKFIVRVNGAHIFNPANIAIVVLLMAFPHHVWVSPGQWGASVLGALALGGFAILVLSRVAKWDMAVLFGGFWATALFGRALWLGDPMSIPMHQMQSGALLIFSFFMISDPKTIPNSLQGRGLFAAAVVATAFVLAFTFQVREGLFYALALVCLIRGIVFYTPVLKRKTA